jgi:hypothetical protein
MAAATMNTEQARFNMIQQQIRPWEVLDPEVLGLLAIVKREDFAPAAHKDLAFADVEVPLKKDAKPSQTMLAPRIEARMLQALGIRNTDKVLEIGAGSGFMAALLAAKAGATYISPFVGRLDDINIDGMDLIRDIRQIYDNYGFGTQILAASIRSANHVREAALAGADVATIPPAVIKALVQHVLTDKGLEQFSKDWAATGQSIL